MYLNPYVLPPAISVLIHIVLTFVVLRKSRSKKVRVYFTLLFLSVILWASCETVLRSFPATPDNYKEVWYYPYAVMCARVMAEGIICMLISGTILSFQYPVRKISMEHYKLMRNGLLVMFFVYSILTLFTPLMVDDVIYYWAGYGASNGPLLVYSVPLLLLIFAVVFYNFYSAYRNARSAVEKNQVKYVLIGALCFVVPVSITGLPSIPPIYGMPTGNFWIIFMDVFWLYGAIKYKLFTVEAVVENGVKELRVSESAKKIEHGDVVLVLSPDGRKGFETFRYLASKMPGLCITTKAPKDVRAEFAFTKLPLIWISEITTKENAIEPTKLEFEISYHIYSFLREGENRVVYLDDIDYLSAVNGFQSTQEFLKSVADEAEKRNSVLIFSVTSEAYDERQMSFIKSVANKELVEEKEGRHHAVGEFSADAGHAIMIEALGEIRTELKAKIKGYKVLGVSAHFPKKFSRGFPEGTEIKSIWITETSGSDEAISPRRMEFEVSQEIISFIKNNAGKGLVYIDAIPTFMLVNDFMTVLKFVKDIVDIAHEYDCRVVFEVPPNLFTPGEKALFERRMDVIYAQESKTPPKS